MQEFVDFILRRYDVRKKRKGSIIELQKNNQVIAKYFVKHNKKIQLHHDDGNDMNRKLREIVRFKLAMNHDIPIVIENAQCTNQTCFKHLIDDFKEEWNIFNGHCKNDMYKNHEQDQHDKLVVDQSSKDQHNLNLNNSELLKRLQDFNTRLSYVVT